MAKLYQIENKDSYYSKIVVADTMKKAIARYEEYLESTLETGYLIAIEGIQSCKLINDYNQSDIII